eukprot:886612-Prorocentrum_minimum.AAC.2
MVRGAERVRGRSKVWKKEVWLASVDQTNGRALFAPRAVVYFQTYAAACWAHLHEACHTPFATGALRVAMCLNEQLPFRAFDAVGQIGLLIIFVLALIQGSIKVQAVNEAGSPYHHVEMVDMHGGVGDGLAIIPLHRRKKAPCAESVAQPQQPGGANPKISINKPH